MKNHINNVDEYNKFYKKSIQDPENFWADQAGQYLSWEKKWDFVLSYDFDDAEIKWFEGGILNASYNCLDRHMDSNKDKIAYYWEGDEPGNQKSITYADLYKQVNRFAAVLKLKGVKKETGLLFICPGSWNFQWSCWLVQE